MNANVKRFDLKETLFWKILYHILRFLVFICSVGTTIVLMLAVILRYCFHTNFYGYDELLLMIAFWLYMMGAAYGSYEDSHIKADLLQVYLKNQKVKDVFLLIGQAIMIFVNLVLFSWSVTLMKWGIEKFPQSTSMHIPLVIAYAAIFLSLLLMAFYHVYYFIGDVRAFIHHDRLRMSLSSEVLLAKGLIDAVKPADGDVMPPDVAADVHSDGATSSPNGGGESADSPRKDELSQGKDEEGGKR